jgi:hypothetical protein
LIVQNLGGALFKILYVGLHDEAIEYGAMLREHVTPYRGKLPLVELIRSYLFGDESALKFREFSEEIKTFLGIE